MLGLLGEYPRAVDDDLAPPKHSEEGFLIVEGDEGRHARTEAYRQRPADRICHLSVEFEPRSAKPSLRVEPDH